MASTIRIKRSSVAGKIPNTTNISTGELALNITDGIMYSTNGSVVFEIGSNLSSLNVTNNFTVDTNTLHVDSVNNRVGIGTANPAYQFEIENTGQNALLVLDRTDGAACFIEGQATRSAFGSVGATPLALAYNSAAVVTIGASGAITVNPDGNGFTFPTSDGTNGQVLQTDGNGNLSFAAASGGSSSPANTFSTINIAGQNSIFAEAAGDTLTFVAGAGVTLTSNSAADSVTIATTVQDDTVAMAIALG